MNCLFPPKPFLISIVLLITFWFHRELPQNVFFVKQRQLSAIDDVQDGLGSSTFDNHLELAPSYLLSWSRFVPCFPREENRGCFLY